MAEFLLLAVSLASLLTAANCFVQGIAGLAERFGVPKIVIGMTLVAFGTSTPELVVNSISAWRGVTDLAFGNLVGACLLNVGLVLALTAIIRPMRLEPSFVTRELPFLAFTVAAVFLMCLDGVLTRNDGGVLLILFLVFLVYLLRQAVGQAQEASAPTAARSMPVLLLFAVAGFAGVSYSAQWTVDHAVGIARQLGVSEAVIGLTIVSVGTTLPELVTSLLAARRGDADLALGNVIGSNLFNLLCILGVVSVLSPVELPPNGMVDVAVMAFLSAVLLPIAIRTGRVISRREGIFLLSVYGAYLSWRLWQATH